MSSSRRTRDNIRCESAKRRRQQPKQQLPTVLEQVAHAKHMAFRVLHKQSTWHPTSISTQESNQTAFPFPNQVNQRHVLQPSTSPIVANGDSGCAVSPRSPRYMRNKPLPRQRSTPNRCSLLPPKPLAQAAEGIHSQLSSLYGSLHALVELIGCKIQLLQQFRTEAEQETSLVLQLIKQDVVQREELILRDVLTVRGMTEFLEDILVMENTFEKIYTPQMRSQQWRARQQHAASIADYPEREQLYQPKIDSLQSLVMLAKFHRKRFAQWVNAIADDCKTAGIETKVSEVQEKGLARAYYKSFCVYGGEHEKGYQKVSDMLRCAFEFDDFDSLYRCFALIEERSQLNGGILRCKDTFAVDHVAFGYRHLLVNVCAPHSEFVVEIQLRHKKFAQFHGRAHHLYRQARLFEVNGENLAYKHAREHCREDVGAATWLPRE